MLTSSWIPLDGEYELECKKISRLRNGGLIAGYFRARFEKIYGLEIIRRNLLQSPIDTDHQFQLNLRCSVNRFVCLRSLRGQEPFLAGLHVRFLPFLTAPALLLAIYFIYINYVLLELYSVYSETTIANVRPSWKIAYPIYVAFSVAYTNYKIIFNI